MNQTTFSTELAQQFPIVAIEPRCVWSAIVKVSDRESLGLGPDGERFIIPIVGGEFWGAPGFESFHGTVRPGGADRQLVRADGVKKLDALYEMQTHDGVVVTIHNQVTIDESLIPNRYAMSVINVTAPQGPYSWLSRRVFVGTLQGLQPSLKSVLIRGYLVEAA
jgi:Protein of unknown function (DUF3237)